ncbi:hypothetical protein PsorP6_014910 [Peronosclerospora sorghi]|uniref:Uncharacterized protein n=1 Tax=Peronosclerospora sorghi TaxID=230839 RepID=A0ACC0VTJ5_9STRA|nr:hypothetical protein PsorP6_014910 [Peronosclerospora sorghi]
MRPHLFLALLVLPAIARGVPTASNSVQEQQDHSKVARGLGSTTPENEEERMVTMIVFPATHVMTPVVPAPIAPETEKLAVAAKAEEANGMKGGVDIKALAKVTERERRDLLKLLSAWHRNVRRGVS